MITTLNEIKKHRPCAGGWKTLLKSLNKTVADDEPLELMTVLDSNGIEDAVWVLRCFDYLDYCLFLADVAESVLHICEKRNDSKAPHLAIQATRDFKAGRVSWEELDAAAATAYDATAATAAYDAYDAAADAAAYTADADADAYSAAYAAADAAANAATNAADANAAARKAKWDANAAARKAKWDANAAARKAKWLEITTMFLSHFSD